MHLRLNFCKKIRKPLFLLIFMENLCERTRMFSSCICNKLPLILSSDESANYILCSRIHSLRCVERNERSSSTNFEKEKNRHVTNNVNKINVV